MRRFQQWMARLLFISLLAIGVTAVSGIASAPSASACTVGPYSYSLYAGINGVYQNVPAYILSWGGINGYPDIGCSTIYQVNAQTKVCGFWGCSYETRAATGWITATSPYNGPNYVSQPCRAGLNRYQTKSEAWLGGAGPNGYTWYYSSNPEYAC